MGVFAGVEKNWAALTDVGRTHVATKGVVQSGLVLNLDAGASRSYGGSGTTWTDLSGSGNTGTLTNGPTYSSSNGGSLVFDGSNQYVNIGTQSLVGSGTAPFTVEIWFYNTKTISGPEYTQLFNIKQDTELFTNLYNPSGTFYIFSAFRGQTQWAIPLTQSDYLNKWICLTFVYNGGNKSTASSFITYTNAVQLPTGSVNLGTAGGVSNTNTIGIAGGGAPYHQGNISAYRIYNRALSAAEIKQNYNAMRGRYSL